MDELEQQCLALCTLVRHTGDGTPAAALHAAWMVFHRKEAR